MKVEKAHLTCLYSDDIRQEASGQTTLIGWHTSNAILYPSVGILLIPKFCINGLLELPYGRKLKTMKIEVRLNDEVLQKIDMPENAVADLQMEAAGIAPDEYTQGVILNLALQFGNFPVPKLGTLHVHVFLDEEEIVGNGLRFVPTPPSPTPSHK